MRELGPAMAVAGWMMRMMVVVVAVSTEASRRSVLAVVEFGFLNQFSFCFGVGDVALGHGGCVLHSFGRQTEVFRLFGTGRMRAD